MIKILAPVITILGDNPATVELGTAYTDAGATATDNSGSAVVTSSGTVDTNTVGSYTITYTATDASGNSSSATRTLMLSILQLLSSLLPEITLQQLNPGLHILMLVQQPDASGTVSVTSSGTVDTNTLGSYTITYTSTDASGNTGTAAGTVNVVDTTPPVITILGISRYARAWRYLC